MKKTNRVLFESNLKGKHPLATVEVKGNATPIKITTESKALPGKTNEWLAEELIISYVSTAFMRTFLTMAEQQNIPISGYECDAIGDAVVENKVPQIAFINIYPKIYTANTEALEQAKKIMEPAMKNNPAGKLFHVIITYHPVFEIKAAPKKLQKEKREVFF